MQHDIFEFDIFLSHSSVDKPVVRVLANALVSAGLKVWFDEWCIPAGGDISFLIEKGLSKSKLFLFCASESSLDSEWVQMERHTAHFRDPINKHKRFVPCLISKCVLPDALARYKHVKYYDEPEKAIESIVELFHTHKDSKCLELTSIPEKTKRCGILFVDDEEKICKLFKKTFDKSYPVYTASSVEEAILTLSQNGNKIGVTISDQRMPRRSGVELLSYLRVHHPNIMRIMVSAYSDYHSLVDAINVGAVHAYLYKPWDPIHLDLLLNSAADSYTNRKLLPGFVSPLPATALNLPGKEVAYSDSKSSQNEDTQAHEKDSTRHALTNKDKLSGLYIKCETKDPEVPFHATPPRHLASISIEISLLAIIQDLGLIITIMRHENPAIKFPLLTARWERKFYGKLWEIKKGLDYFQISKQIPLQNEVLTSLAGIKTLIFEGMDENNILYGKLNQMFGAYTALHNIANHYSILESYLRSQEEVKVPAL